MPEANDDEEVCQMVFESAFDKGAEMCSESGLRSIIRDRLNLPEDIDADDILDYGLDASSTLEETRKWVYARTAELVIDEDVPLRKAERRAWQEAEDERQPSFASNSTSLDL